MHSHGGERVVGERVIAGYPVGGFCLETKPVFQFHGCHIKVLEWLSKVVSTAAKGSGRFQKNQARKTKIDKRFAVCTNPGKKKSDS